MMRKDIFILNQIMIEKSKVYPEFNYAPQRYQIDYFHNPYLAKLNIKLTPRPQIQTNRLLSPLSLQNNLYIAQSIPLYKNQRLKLALVWKEYLTHKYARAHFGLNTQYKIYDSVRIKAKTMVGITSLLELEVNKKITNDIEGFVGYSGFLENNNIYSSFHLGFKKGIFSTAFSKKINNHTQMTLALSKQITDDIFIESYFNGGIQDFRKGQLQLLLNQKLDSRSSTALGIVANPYYSEGSLKVEYERLFTKNQKIIVSTEYSQGKSVFYFGFKNLNFNFIFPFFAVDSIVPVVIGATAYGLTYLYKRFYSKKVKTGNIIDLDDNPKTVQNRLEELQLIGQKAADHYEREKISRNGLRIQQAYIGPAEEIEEFMDNPQRYHLLVRSQEHKQKFVDLTVTLRFYVMKGQLKLRKGQKNSLLGFYRKSNSHNRIGVRYIKNDVVKTAFFDYMDPIVISNLQ